MLLQNEPFRDIDAWFDRMTGRASSNGSWPMPMDAYKRGNDLWVDLDLPATALTPSASRPARTAIWASAASLRPRIAAQMGR
jgi:hypothetical protein